MAMRLAPYLLPFLIFMVGNMIESRPGLETYYPIIYTIKIAAVIACIAAFRRSLPAWSSKGMVLAVASGIMGVFVWVGLTHLNANLGITQAIPDSLWPDGREAFNPFEKVPAPWTLPFLAIRFLGLVVVVAIMEEMLWRGFVWRYLIDEDFEKVPFGQWSTTSFVATLVLFALVHTKSELLASLAWGSMVNLVYWRSGNLWAAVVMHAVTNLLLGIYVVTTGAWYFW